MEITSASQANGGDSVTESFSEFKRSQGWKDRFFGDWMRDVYQIRRGWLEAATCLVSSHWRDDLSNPLGPQADRIPLRS